MNTSHAAYLSVNTTELEEMVYQAVLSSKERGVIADELEASMNMRSNVITPPLRSTGAQAAHLPPRRYPHGAQRAVAAGHVRRQIRAKGQ